ncbi:MULTISPECIES: lipopolysaccharide transport periplasmic protein LptA [Methyloversatilis]|jgi:lipopolysaccharide export system protein LptA|uniref:lipopolysaccharide transport periplasmic protein LptA n=2 Tax=Sterolibacteriaceae TaxID=2008793 RepID=UPI0003608635|nr:MULTISPECIES: lipopolysaccharide transport periplasmic protein LptA [Methyloversatilis]MBV5285975.1 lipopolysaccharide transport periplasmic protein LptA [Methyloversatilis discipulorum]MCR6667448.1 lipopolysaccharide transport periplasmic protein LptA [Methyloversatilis sp.]PZU52685.1 MAG: lipopolysaccharide transport periplasmic protein LptA [Thauera sp.]
MTLRPALTGLILLNLVLAAGLSTPARAERADRDKPVNLEADKVTVDDRTRTHTFEGNVVFTQGTLTIKANRVVVTQDATGYQKGVATGGEGGLARFRQKREGQDLWMEGEAERIEHDAKTEITRFFVRAHVKSGGDEVRGQYIEYNSISENYTVTNSGDAKSVPSAGDQSKRVRAIIQPKSAPKE